MSMAVGSVGSMSQASLAKMHQEMFKRLDQNGDGEIDKTEFAAARPSRGSRQAGQVDKADELFGQIDTDQDGSISETESETFLTKMDEIKKGGRPPAGPPPELDWQTGLAQAMYAQVGTKEMHSSTAVSMYA